MEETNGKESKKGRAIEGMVMGIRKEMIDKNEGIRTVEEGIIQGKVKRGGEKWRLVEVYVSGGIEETLERMEEWMKKKGEN